MFRSAALALAALVFAAAPSARAAGGDLDPSFGRGGRVMVDMGNSADIANAVALQADGKVLVGGTTYINNDFSGEDFALVRLNADGTRDPAFGADGRVSTDFPGLAAEIAAMVVQPDGKILVAGGAFPLFAFLGNFTLARYLPDGSLDPSFGTGGIVSTHFPGLQGSFASSIALQADGRIVAAGTGYVDFSSDESSNTDFALARYNADGSLDASFGSGGLVTTDFAGRNDDAFAVMVQPDGRIVAVGSARNSSTDYDFAAARYFANGQLDTSFGSGGKVHVDFIGGFDRAQAAVLQPDGRVVAAGFATSRQGGSQNFAVLRWNVDGTLDTTFNASGKRQIDFGSCCQSAYAVLLQRDGKLVLAGYPNSESTDSDFVLARLDAAGALDPGFGTGGRVRTSFGDLNGGATDAVLMPDGRIVAVGFQATNTPQSAQFAVARYRGR